MDQKIKERENIERIVKGILADTIGVDPEDVKNEDVFSDDLHMTSANLSDFIESLGAKGFDVATIDLTEIATVEELIETLRLQEPIT